MRRTITILLTALIIIGAVYADDTPTAPLMEGALVTVKPDWSMNSEEPIRAEIVNVPVKESGEVVTEEAYMPPVVIETVKVIKEAPKEEKPETAPEPQSITVDPITVNPVDVAIENPISVGVEPMDVTLSIPESVSVNLVLPDDIVPIELSLNEPITTVSSAPADITSPDPADIDHSEYINDRIASIVVIGIIVVLSVILLFYIVSGIREIVHHFRNEKERNKAEADVAESEALYRYEELSAKLDTLKDVINDIQLKLREIDADIMSQNLEKNASDFNTEMDALKLREYIADIADKTVSQIRDEIRSNANFQREAYDTISAIDNAMSEAEKDMTARGVVRPIEENEKDED